MSKQSSNIGLAVLFGLLLSAAGGCSEESAPPAGKPTMSQPGLSEDQAFYGVNVQLSYSGPREKLTDAAMVYVFLRPPGKRMPLTVQQFPGRELPKTVSFAGASDQPVELVARLSPSGRVDRSPEDVEVVQSLSSLRHPPQTLVLIMGERVSAESTTTAMAAGESKESVGMAEIQTSIRIADGHHFPPDAVVFVIARRPGQVMPSAVRRLTVADLPADIALSDADSMTFSNRLSAAPSLELFARVSPSGSASRSSSDWYSEVVPLDPQRAREPLLLKIGAPGG